MIGQVLRDLIVLPSEVVDHRGEPVELAPSRGGRPPTPQSGTDISDHSVHGPAVVQLLKGQAHFELAGSSVDVGLGNAITLAAGVEHRLSVPEDALLLLVISNT